MPPSRRTPPPSDAPPTARLWWLAGGVALLAIALGAWFFWPREDKLAAVREMQKAVLASAGAPDRAAIDAVIRTVDRMSQREVWAAYSAAGAEWKRIKQETVTAYFAASEADRARLIDEHIGRMEAYHDLLVALNPNSSPDSPAYLPRQRRRRGEAPPPETDADRDRRELAERFDAAVAARAKSRGVTLPEFR